MKIQAGDIIAFSGSDWVSDAINLVTWGLPRRGIHHVGIVSLVHNEPVLYEAMSSADYRGPCCRTGRKVAGFQAHPLREILETVKGQRIYHLPLRRPLYPHEEMRLQEYLDSLLGTPYDRLGAFRAGGIFLRSVASLIHRECLSSLFCSEVAAAALSWIGVFQTRTASRWSPNALCRRLRYEGVCGEYRRIK